jgi:threonine/homoserine/homoserine lactone efflux protein
MLIPLAFVLISIVVELTPGPNMVYLVVLTAREGRWAGLSATLGVALGLSTVAAAAAFGLTAIIATSRWLYEALRWGGALYLLWLAWEGLRSVKAAATTDIAVEPRYSKFFLQGFTTNVLNPKAGLFYVAVIPTFVDASYPTMPQIVWLSAVYVMIATSIHTVLVLASDAARPWLEDARYSSIIRRVLSAMLAAIAIWLLLSTRYVAPV